MLVADTRTAQKIKAGKDFQTSNSINNNTLGIRSSKETPSKLMTPSPSILRKSENLEKKIPKSQTSDKLFPSSLLRSSDRGKNLTFSSQLRQSAEELSPLNSKKRKEKTVIQVTMESQKAEVDPEKVGTGRVRRNARAYMAIYKKQRVLGTGPDVSRELEQVGHSLQVSSPNGHGVDPIASGGENVSNRSREMILGTVREECTDKVSSEARPELITGPKDYSPGIYSDDVRVNTSLLDTVVLDADNGYCSPCPERIADDGSGRLSENCSDSSYMVASGSDNSTRSGKLKDLVSSDNGDKDMQPKDAICDGDISNLHGTCSENKRVGNDSPNQELCSNSQAEVGIFSTIKDSGDDRDACTSETSRKYSCGQPLVEILSDDEHNQKNVCAACNKDGELQYCKGKWCRKCYHLWCMDPSLSEVQAGVWYCAQCVNKKPLNEQQSNFLEYWVPAQLSKYQLELYCSTLLSNSLYLCSCSKNEPFGVLQEILLTIGKHCDHPYLLNSSIQKQLIAEKRVSEILDTGIKVCGKLQLLDMMLSEIKTRCLQVLVLYQLTVGSPSLGIILEDFLLQRFGQNSYEHVDAGVTSSKKKQAALNRFNEKESGQFVLLLENRACSSTIKSLKLDVIIIYNSNWNPANDLRSLHKICIDTKVEKIKVFRLYTSCTVEERALVLSKQNLNIDNSLQTKSRATINSLLCWGASYLFSKLDEHLIDNSTSTSALDFAFGSSLFNDTSKEVQAIISGNENTNANSFISKVQFGVGRYFSSIPLPGEAKAHLKDGEEPHVFWATLLSRGIPQWKYLKEESPRNRKRVQYFDESSNESGREDNAPRQRRKVVDENSGDPPAIVQVESLPRVTQDAGPNGGHFTSEALNYQSSQRDGDSRTNNLNSLFGGSSFGTDDLANEKVASSDEQNSLHLLQLETKKLCQILKLSDASALATRRFLEYVSKNHNINSDLPAIMHALQISLCWTGASITKHKIDKRESLNSTKQLLNYECTEDQVTSVYLKMRDLKKLYLKNQKNEIQEFLKTWEATRHKLDRDYKLESAFIRCLHGQGSVRADKLKALDDDFKKKMEEHNLLKKLKLKDFVVQRSVVKSEETKMGVSDFVSPDLSSPVEQVPDIVPSADKDHDSIIDIADNTGPDEVMGTVQHIELSKEPLEEHNEEVARASNLVQSEEPSVQSVEAAIVPDCHDLPPQHVLQDELLQNSVQVELQDQGATTIVDNHNASSVQFSTSGFVETIYPAPATDETVIAQLAGNETRTVVAENSEQMQDQFLQDLVPAEDQDASTVENHNALSAETDQTVIPVIANNETTHESENSEQLHYVPVDASSHQPSVTEGEQQNHDDDEQQNRGMVPELIEKIAQEQLSQRVDDEQQNRDDNEQQNHGVVPELPPQEVLQDELSQSPVPAELQDQDTSSTVENHNTSPISCSTSGIVETINPIPSNFPLPETHEPVIPLLASNEIMSPVAENSEQLHDATVNISIHQSIVTETGHPNLEDQGEQQLHRDLMPELMETVAQEPIFQLGESLGLHCNNPVLGQNFESSSSYSMNRNPNILPVGVDAGYQRGLINPFLAPPLPQVDFLQCELERMQKESESIDKNCEAEVAKLKSDRDKEIRLVIKEIMEKYEQKVQEAKAEFNLKKIKHNANMDKVLISRIIAEKWRSNCLDPSYPGIPRMHRGFPSNYISNPHQRTMQHQMRLTHHAAPPHQPGPTQLNTNLPSRPNQHHQLHHRAPSRQPGPTQLNPKPGSRPVQYQQLQPHLVQSSSPLRHNFASPPLQNIQQLPTLPRVPGPPSRPPVIGSITFPSNSPRVAGEVRSRSRAPHLQPFNRSNASSSTTTTTTSLLMPSQVVQARFPPPPNTGPEHRMNVENYNPVHQNCTSLPLPDISSAFQSMELHEGGLNGSKQTSNIGETDVVCLSDNDE